MVDRQTEMHELELAPASSSGGSSSSAAADDADAIACCVLNRWTQRAFYEMLHGPLTALQHQTALRRHAACSRCLLNDVLRVSDLGQRVFLMVPMRWRGPFARVCREWCETSRLCWSADEYELVQIHQHVFLRNLGGPVTQVAHHSSLTTHHSSLIFDHSSPITHHSSSINPPSSRFTGSVWLCTHW